MQIGAPKNFGYNPIIQPVAISSKHSRYRRQAYEFKQAVVAQSLLLKASVVATICLRGSTAVASVPPRFTRRSAPPSSTVLIPEPGHYTCSPTSSPFGQSGQLLALKLRRAAAFSLYDTPLPSDVMPSSSKPASGSKWRWQISDTDIQQLVTMRDFS